MENRQPTYPGRVKLTPVPGQENTYDMERADEPTVEGTPLNKQTLLQDATCAILDIPNTSVPNDAFAKLALGIGKYGYVIQVQFTGGPPVEGATITGANAPDGGEAVTDANGQAVVVSAEISITIGVESPYIDIADASGVVIQSTGILTAQTVTLEEKTQVQLNSSSQEIVSPFSDSIDFCAVAGGGAGGQDYYQQHTGGNAPFGGAGGETKNALGVAVPEDRILNILIGAGGEINSTVVGGTGSNGGNTTVTTSEGVVLVTATGGIGGKGTETPLAGGTLPIGNGNGYYKTSTTQYYATGSTVHMFDDPSLTIPGGGGGNGGGYENPTIGGSPYGGNSASSSANAGDGRGPGGGGGAGLSMSGRNFKPGNGANGTLFIRFHHLTAEK